MVKWKEKTLGEVTSFITKGIPPKYSDYESESTIWVLNQKCNRNFEISYSDARLHDYNLKKIPENKMLMDGDVLINSTGTGTAGRVAQLQNIQKPTTIDGHMILLRPTDDIDSLYYGYAIKACQSQIEGFAEGSTGQTELNRKRLQDEIIVRYPVDKQEQKAIAYFLLDLDEKIKINVKINNNLLAQAQLLFESIYLSGNTAKMSDLICEIESGSRPKGGALSQGIPSIGAEKIERFGIYDFSSEKYISEEFFAKLKRGIVKSSDVLLYKDGAYTGKVSMALDGFPHEICAVNEHVFILRTYYCRFQNYLYCCLSKKEIRDMVFALASSKATQPGLNQNEVMGIEINLPDEDILTSFEDTVSPLMHLVVSNANENKRLSEIRDTLLPKLMSGEIDVSDIDL